MPKKSKKRAEGKTPLPAAKLAAPAPAPESKPQSESVKAPKPAPKRKAAPKKAAAKKAPAKKSGPKKTKAISKAAAALTAEAALDLEDLHRMQGESPATPEGGQAEAAAQAADTFEDAIESNNAGEVQALGIETDAAPAAADADSVDDPEGRHPEDEDSEDEDSDDQDSEDQEAEDDFEPAPRPPAKMERLQKILAQAGVASRRHAEELITQGRIQVNGKIITELGTKADRNRDHIRVDGKLLQGAERHRYFVLNKPRGFVTTVKDPEGRPTVMQFFAKMNERLYPVGRLDYLSEGLLLVTNDGELANKLTKAASGVEKTYLVKVSGQPTEEQLETLRAGVSIDRGKPGEGRVRTSAARVRQVRVGENPWYEVVLIEGRNRELRKMFEEIGHFVEKIRRVGYGPLILDQEPGNLRELDEQELKMLRLAADGKWKPKRIKSTAMLPAQAGRTVDPEATKTRPGKPFLKVRGSGTDRGQNRIQDRIQDRGPVPGAGGGGQDRPRTPNQTQDRTQDRSRDRGFAPRRDVGRTFGRPAAGGERRPFTRPPADRGEGRGFSKPPANRTEGRSFSKPPLDRGTDRAADRGTERGGERRSFARPPASGTGQRPFRDRPSGPPTGGTARPRFDRPAFPPRRAEGDAGFADRKPPFKPRSDRHAGGTGAEGRFPPRTGKPAGRPFGGDRGRPPQGAGRSFAPRPEGRGTERPAGPPRREGGFGPRGTARPPAGGRAAFTSSGVPRPGGARPSSKPSSGGAGRTGFQGRGPGGGSPRPGGGRPGSPRPGSNGSSPRSGFKGKPGGSFGRKRP